MASEVSDLDIRRKLIVSVLVETFDDLMAADPAAFRTKFRKMAASPFAFYRGSACLFYADVAGIPDRWVDERTSRVWIHGDLHAENFGTYLSSQGLFVFDVNDFDEAYLGAYTWDLKRFCASLALLGWQKALPDEAITDLCSRYLHAYVNQVRHFVSAGNDYEFALRLDTATGPIRDVLRSARHRTRSALLHREAELTGDDRRFRHTGTSTRELSEAEQAKVCEALTRYFETIPEGKRRASPRYYDVKDVVGRSGLGIGSAGLPTYSVLLEGSTQALENDVVLSIKQGNVSAVSRVVDDPRIRGYFQHEGHGLRSVQRALQAHTDPLLGYTDIDGVGFVVNELSPYEVDLDWDDLTEPADIAQVVSDLGRATAKMHCVSDSDSDQSLVPFQTEEAINAAIENHTDEFVVEITGFAHSYARCVRDDHRLFVDAFRSGQIPGIPVT